MSNEPDSLSAPPVLKLPRSSFEINEQELIVADSTSSSHSRGRARTSISDRVQKLLESLETFDSLYLCPTTKPFPENIKAKIKILKNSVQNYEIVDYYGVTQYYAVETTKRICYRFCSNNRPFEIFMYDANGDLVFEIAREGTPRLFVCGVDSCFSGIETVANLRHNINYIGSVISESGCSRTTYIVQNEFYDETFYIKPPRSSFCCPCKLMHIHQFFICLPGTETSVGKVIYGYDGLSEELVPNPNTVGVIFPPRCGAPVKACLLAAAFMLDITYFNQRGCTIHRCVRSVANYVILFGSIFLLYWYILRKLVDSFNHVR